ncbi:MAG: MbnP family protein [Chitinophagaceae bacterium]
MKFLFIVIMLLLNTQLLKAQDNSGFQLKFEPMFNNTPLVLNDSFYHISNNDSIQISKLKFYISAIQFYNNNKLVFTEKNSYHLVDASNRQSLNIIINKPQNIKFNSIKFNLGIDSATNAKGALGGALDPTKGMYWAWHSGYINFKLEGTSNICNTRNNVFEFHLGGFAAPYNSLQTIQLPISNTTIADIAVDINEFLLQINLAKTNAIMTPSKETIELSQKATKMFYIK